MSCWGQELLHTSESSDNHTNTLPDVLLITPTILISDAHNENRQTICLSRKASPLLSAILWSALRKPAGQMLLWRSRGQDKARGALRGADERDKQGRHNKCWLKSRCFTFEYKGNDWALCVSAHVCSMCLSACKLFPSIEGLKPVEQFSPESFIL